MSPRPLAERFLTGEPTAWMGWDPRPLSFEETLAAWKDRLARRGSPGSPATLQVYGHFAYCRMHCLFCQCWHALARNDDQLETQTDAMVRTLARYRESFGRRIEATNASFGGGTPTAISAPMLRRFLEAFRATFDVRYELACEGHPATLDDEKLAILLAGGVNRISMGLQSLDPEVLDGVGRSNDTLPRIRHIVREAQRGGAFVNLDLILGLPRQSVASFEDDLRTAMDVGPDMLTVYRYQPVNKLPQAPEDALRIDRVFTRERLLRALRAGYATVSTIDAASYSVIFFRGTGRTARFAARNVAAWASGRLAGRDEIPRYTDLDSTEVQLLGLGTGATSHLYGYGWYREVSALKTLGKSGEPMLWGTPLTTLDEARTALLLGLARGERVSLPRIERVSGVSRRVLRAELEPHVASDVLRCSRETLQLCGHASPEARKAVLESLLPQRDMQGDSAGVRVRRTDEHGQRDDVQKDLLELDPALRDAANALVPLRTPPRKLPTDSRALAAWCLALGVRPGQTIEGALVERVEGASIHFRLEASPERTLAVVFATAGSGRAYWESERFAVSYAPRSDQPLTEAEARFLDALRERTRAAERAAAS